MLSTVFALVVKWDELLPALVNTAIFVGIGLIVFAIAFWIMTRVAPFSVRKEIEEDQNTSLAVLMGSIILGIAIIIAAAISS
jgi:putative membrane protein